MGDPARNAMLKAIIETIEKDNLLEKVRDNGKYFLAGLNDLQVSKNRMYFSTSQFLEKLQATV